MEPKVNDAQSEEETNTDHHKKFEELCDEYYSIVNETSPEFQKECEAIRDSFSKKIQALDNYARSKRRLVFKESLFHQQIQNDLNIE